ncbi:MAG: hypothetical protein ABIJ83_03610 [Patescibacteria group bacterium]
MQQFFWHFKFEISREEQKSIDQAAKRWEVTFGNVMNLFTSLALGITNQDLSQIPAGN